jgi:formylglycine-generating enzyme required for sulfatase activity
MTTRDQGETSNDPRVLRAEVERLRGELDRALRSGPRERDVDSVTDQLALQQEIDSLRQSLRERDRVVNTTAAQCKRLEDELEDQHLAYDSLKQDLERKRHSLATVQEQVARLSRERQEIEERYQALLVAGGTAAGADRKGSGSGRKKGFGAFAAGRSVPFLGGLATGALVFSLGAWLLVRSGLLPVADSAGVGGGNASADLHGPTGSGAAPAADARSGLGGELAASPAEQPPTFLGTLRDRLRDGSPGPLMAVIGPGTFTMGKPGAIPSDDRNPAHPVRLRGYLIGAYEVTFEEFDRYARATGSRLPNDFGWGRGRRPVVDVTWGDAVAYARWLSEQTGEAYRLPSESEWEYAAAAGTRTNYWWGFETGMGRAACFDCGSPFDNRSTAPVGSFAANPLGLYDTAGNAMEWVADCYRPNYIGAPLDGSPVMGVECQYRVARGGAFNKPARSMGSTVRHRFDPITRLDMLGFRLARDG